MTGVGLEPRTYGLKVTHERMPLTVAEAGLALKKPRLFLASITLNFGEQH